MAEPVLQEIHDEWLAQKPDGALHDPATCPFCNLGNTSPTDGLEEGKQLMADEIALQSKDEEITKLSAQVAELLAQASVAAVDAKIAEAAAAADAKVADLQAALDTKTLEAEKAKADYAELVTMLETAQADAAAATAAEGRWAGRLAEVKENASWFTDEQVAERQARWSAMPDEEFAALINDFKAVGVTKPAGSVTPATALVASASGAPSARSLVAEVMGLRFAGVDVRKVS